MNYDDILVLLPPEELQPKASRIFGIEKERLVSMLGDVDIQHVGSGSVPGAWGKFDVDIQIRVDKSRFDEVMDIMKRNYVPKHPTIWTESFGLFIHPDIPIDLNVTVIGSECDVYFKLRDTLIENPDILEKYNQFKKSCEGKKYGEYRMAKHHFFAESLSRVRIPDHLFLKQ